MTTLRRFPAGRCRVCSLWVRTPLPLAQELDARYREGYWEAYRAEQVTEARHNVHAHAMRWIAERHAAPGLLVDVGCGGGAFLTACRAAGWKGIGYDPSAAAVSHARSLGLEAEARPWPPCPLRDETVDAVTFINVLDHLLDPFEALREARRVLRPRGVVYIRVPNGPFHARLLTSGLLRPLRRLAVFHLYGFSRRSFLYHLPRLGFTDAMVRTAPPSSGDPYGGEGRMRGLVRRGFKVADQWAYRWLAQCGLRDRAWGPSLEVLAVKSAVVPRTTPVRDAGS